MYTRTKNALCAALVCFALVASMALPGGVALRQAHADELSDAQAALDSASKELDSLTAEYDALQSDLDDIEDQIDDKLKQVQDAQAAMLEGQEDLGDTVLAEYKSDGSLSLMNIFFGSESISEMVKGLSYYSAIQEDQAEQIAEQKQRRDTFQASLDELDAQRDAQQDLIDQAEEKKAQAEQVVSDASSKVSSIKEKQAQEQLAALQAQAKAMQESEDAKASSASSKSESSKWNTNTDRPAASGGSSDSGSSNSGSSSSSSGSNSSSSSSDSGSSKGWKTGLASAYGGSSDSSTPNPGTTANGSVCNDSSMGVAIPMSWSNYRSYFGRAVEIKYNGKTVIATINDCGGLGGGSRSLDLQPGVFKAFGFKTCQAWGVRTVQYRIL